MKTTGIIDRIEGETAVILIGEDEKNEIHWPSKNLPEKAGEGTVLSIAVKMDKEKTKNRKKEMQNLLDKLKNNQGE